VNIKPEEHEKCATEDLTKSMADVFDSAYDGTKILIVDDDPKSRKETQKHLRDKGFEARAISRVERVHEMVRMFKPHFIVLDVDGIDDLEKILYTYADRILICTGTSGYMPEWIADAVQACFGKKELDKLRKEAKKKRRAA